MAVQGQARVQRPTLRPLSKQEIDRRIESVWTEVLETRPSGSEDASEDDLRPMWIGAAEFVRRMRAFLVEN